MVYEDEDELLEREVTYKVIRTYAKRPGKVLARGLTLEQAQTHCRSPETSSRTCTTEAGKKRTELYGPWFDLYETE